jgi:hypothetical protein
MTMGNNVKKKYFTISRNEYKIIDEFEEKKIGHRGHGGGG